MGFILGFISVHLLMMMMMTIIIKNPNIVI